MTLPAAHERLAARLDSRVENPRLDAFALVVTYALELPDGAVRRFQLCIQTRGKDAVSVRELDAARQLPAACPERHINHDGGFCLGVAEDEPDLATAAGVDQWWADLAGYLLLQVLADATRNWPEQCAWRHGAAAKPQRELEQLLIGEPWLATTPIVPLANGRVMDRRAPCPCGSGRAKLTCHEEAMVRAGRLRRQIEEREAEYYRNWKGACCGTMASCGVLREANRRTK